MALRAPRPLDSGPSDGLRCSHTWLSPTLTLAGVQPGARVLTVVEGGDEVMSFLAAGAEVVAFAPDADQRALLALLLSAVVDLPVHSVRALLGYDAAGRRVWFYHHVRARLDAEARAWWDPRERMVRLGLWRQGEREVDLAARGPRLAGGLVGGKITRGLWSRQGPAWRRVVASRWSEAEPLLRPLWTETPPEAWPWLTPAGILACRTGRIRIVRDLRDAGHDFDHVHLGEHGDDVSLAARGRTSRRWGQAPTALLDPAAPFSPWVTTTTRGA